MRESRADTSRAIGLALLLHALVFLAMFAGLWWTKTQRPASAAGSPVSAELVDAGDLSQAMQRTLANRPEPVTTPEPMPEPVEEEAVPLPQPLQANYTDGSDFDGDFSGTIGAQYKFTQTWGMTGEVEFADGGETYLVGLRASF